MLIKEAIKLSFFILVEYLEHQHLWVWLQAYNGQKFVSLFLFWEMKAIPCDKLPRNWRSHTTLCTTPFTQQNKLSLTRIERGVRGPGVSNLRNRHLTSPQMSASLKSTPKTPASTSTVKWQIRDADLLDRVAKKKQYLRLANENKRLRWAKEHRH